MFPNEPGTLLPLILAVCTAPLMLLPPSSLPSPSPLQVSGVLPVTAR